MKKSEITDFLPALSKNKKFLRDQKQRKRRAEAVAEREMSMSKRRKLAEKRELAKQEAAAAAAATGSRTNKKAASKKEKSGSSKKPSKGAKAAAVSKKTTLASKKGLKKGDAPKTEIGGQKTGKETLVKKRARELLAAKKQQQQRAADVEKGKKTKTNKKSVSFDDEKEAARAAAEGEVERQPFALGPAAMGRDEHEEEDEEERAMLAQTIQGFDERQPATADDTAVLYPDIPFVSEYASARVQEQVEEGALLAQANRYFTSLARRERQLYTTAKEHLRNMRRVNERGGDKDGFRYVLPKNVKSVVRQMLAQEQQSAAVASGREAAPYVAPELLSSTFGGDGVKETEEKPMRRKKKRYSTLTDFYQFQVSKKWTRNAERFLKRGRVNKSMFEAKKHQRSIRKL